MADVKKKFHVPKLNVIPVFKSPTASGIYSNARTNFFSSGMNIFSFLPTALTFLVLFASRQKELNSISSPDVPARHKTPDRGNTEIKPSKHALRQPYQPDNHSTVAG